MKPMEEKSKIATRGSVGNARTLCLLLPLLLLLLQARRNASGAVTQLRSKRPGTWLLRRQHNGKLSKGDGRCPCL
jgi:hypothetical protein